MRRRANDNVPHDEMLLAEGLARYARPRKPIRREHNVAEAIMGRRWPRRNSHSPIGAAYCGADNMLWDGEMWSCDEGYPDHYAAGAALWMATEES